MAAEAATSPAEIQARPGRGHRCGGSEPSSPWTQGTIGLKGSVLALEANSMERLEMFSRDPRGLGGRA
jgi:hypothetical protein